MSLRYPSAPCWRHKVALLGLWMALALLSATSVAEAAKPSQDAACKKLFGQKEYIQAGACFERFLPKKRPKALDAATKLRLGRRIRNAVTSYRFAAKAAKKASVAAYARERAAGLLDVYLKWALHENAFRKNSAMVMLYKLRKQIGYAQVTILTHSPKDRVEVIGYEYRKSFQGPRWSGRLRPGTYRVIVLSGAKQRPFSAPLRVEPGQPTFFQLPASHLPARRAPGKRKAKPIKPPPRSRSLGRWATALLIVGGVAGIASLSLLAASKQVEADRDRLYADTKPAPGTTLPLGDIGNTRLLHQAQNTGSQLATSSLIVAAVSGAGLIGGGICLILFLKQPSQPQRPSTPPDARALSLH